MEKGAYRKVDVYVSGEPRLLASLRTGLIYKLLLQESCSWKLFNFLKIVQASQLLFFMEKMSFFASISEKHKQKEWSLFLVVKSYLFQISAS